MTIKTEELLVKYNLSGNQVLFYEGLGGAEAPPRQFYAKPPHFFAPNIGLALDNQWQFYGVGGLQWVIAPLSLIFCSFIALCTAV